MFAALAGSSDEDDDAHDLMPPPRPAAARTADLLPEANDAPAIHDGSDSDDSEVDLLGGIDPDDLQTTIATLHALAADLTLFRSRPMKGVREAVGPLAQALVGGSDGSRGMATFSTTSTAGSP